MTDAPEVTGDWLAAPGTQAVMGMLSDAGHRALVVGGCVRNALLGAPVADIDISTDARPERVVELAEAAGFRPVPTGIEHGTVTVIAHGAPHEVTTFRRDVETDGRRAVVAFSDRVEEDAARRDFTMNALYAEKDGTLVDPLDGLPDLRARRLRFVGTPMDRVREDYLRILRFFRFHAWYADPGGGIDADALDACARGAEGIEGLSGERIGAEMRKLLAAPDPAPAVAAMAAAGVLMRVLPGADPAILAPLVHLEDGRAPSWPRRAAALGGEGARRGWRLSNAEARELDVRRDALAAGTSVEEVAWRHGADVATDVALIRAAGVPEPLGPDMAERIARAATASFPLSAADLMPDLQGPALGAALKRAEAHWIASGFALDRDALRAQALEG